jgi:hypothetical protein
VMLLVKPSRWRTQESSRSGEVFFNKWASLIFLLIWSEHYRNSSLPGMSWWRGGVVVWCGDLQIWRGSGKCWNCLFFSLCVTHGVLVCFHDHWTKGRPDFYLHCEYTLWCQSSELDIALPPSGASVEASR